MNIPCRRVFLSYTAPAYHTAFEPPSDNRLCDASQSGNLLIVTALKWQKGKMQAATTVAQMALNQQYVMPSMTPSPTMMVNKITVTTPTVTITSTPANKERLHVLLPTHTEAHAGTPLSAQRHRQQRPTQAAARKQRHAGGVHWH